MLACGATEMAEAISSDMDARHNDGYLKTLFDKPISMVKQEYKDMFIEAEEFALRNVF